MPHFPTPHPAPARFDVPDALQALSSDLEIPGVGGGRTKGPPAFTDHFPAMVRSGPCDSSAGGDFADARYYLDRAVPAAGAAETARLDVQVDRMPGVGECLTATNLAELPANSHLLAAGTVVHAFGMATRGGGKVYFFNHAAGQQTAVVVITGIASGGGKYIGQTMGGLSTAGAGGTLAMPEGLSSGTAALILNEEEDGQTGHRLAIGSYAVGQVVGEAAGETIVVIRGALGALSGPTSLSGSGVSADTTTWSKASNGTPLSVQVQTRTAWDSSSAVLYAYMRTFSFDARGVLSSVSAEAQVTVDAAVACV
jgi:hypothetical protein